MLGASRVTRIVAGRSLVLTFEVATRSPTSAQPVLAAQTPSAFIPAPLMHPQRAQAHGESHAIFRKLLNINSLGWYARQDSNL